MCVCMSRADSDWDSALELSRSFSFLYGTPTLDTRHPTPDAG